MGERRRNLMAGGLAVLLLLAVAVALPNGAQAQTDTWYGEYFATEHLVGAPAFARNDVAIDFAWGEDAPAPKLPKDGFAVRWSKYQDFEAGTYMFFTTTDDGVRLYVDDLPVVNDWKEHDEITRSATVRLSAGRHALRMEMFDTIGNATARLRWERSGTAGQPAATPTPAPVGAATGVATAVATEVSTSTPSAGLTPGAAAGTATTTAVAMPATGTATPAVAAGPGTQTVTPALTGAAPGGTGTATPTPAVATGGSVYLVQRGDTLRSLASRFGTTVDALLAANPGVRAGRIFIGQRLIVPSGAATPNGSGTPAATTSPATPGTGGMGGTPTVTTATTPDSAAVGTASPQATTAATAVTGAASTGTPAPLAPAPGATGQARGMGRPVQLFFVSEGTGNVGCGDEIVGVQRELPRTAAPLRGTLTLLLAEKQERYGESGLYNALHQSDLRIDRISRRGNVWTVELSGTLTLGGACDNPRVIEQLRQTALQFPTVREVRFLLDGVELEKVLSGQ